MERMRVGQLLPDLPPLVFPELFSVHSYFTMPAVQNKVITLIGCGNNMKLQEKASRSHGCVLGTSFAGCRGLKLVVDRCLLCR